MEKALTSIKPGEPVFLVVRGNEIKHGPKETMTITLAADAVSDRYIYARLKAVPDDIPVSGEATQALLIYDKHAKKIDYCEYKNINDITGIEIDERYTSLFADERERDRFIHNYDRRVYITNQIESIAQRHFCGTDTDKLETVAEILNINMAQFRPRREYG